MAASIRGPPPATPPGSLRQACAPLLASSCQLQQSIYIRQWFSFNAWQWMQSTSIAINQCVSIILALFPKLPYPCSVILQSQASIMLFSCWPMARTTAQSRLAGFRQGKCHILYGSRPKLAYGGFTQFARRRQAPPITRHNIYRQCLYIYWRKTPLKRHTVEVILLDERITQGTCITALQVLPKP